MNEDEGEIQRNEKQGENNVDNCDVPGECGEIPNCVCLQMMS